MTARTQTIMVGVAAAIISGAALAYFWPRPDPDLKIGAGREIQKIYVPVYQKAETKFKRDTIELTKWRTRYDTMIVTQRITDTVWVKEFIRVSDSTVRSCSAAVVSCAEAKNALLRINEGLRLELAGEKAKRPSRFRTAAERVVIFSAGVGVGAIVQTVRKAP